jgi:hypothetical protein
MSVADDAAAAATATPTSDASCFGTCSFTKIDRNCAQRAKTVGSSASVWLPFCAVNHASFVPVNLSSRLAK